MEKIPGNKHNIEVQKNFVRWEQKPLLRKIYINFYQIIAQHLRKDIEGEIVELGSGIGMIKKVIPNCICTDIFPNPWIDKVENAYTLSFDKNSISNLILFDVWHHLQYPGNALGEFHRVLKMQGRLIIFEPAISALGLIVYGIMHSEPINLKMKIEWFAPDRSVLHNTNYYAAQGNASRIFLTKKYEGLLKGWNEVLCERMASISYVTSGGYSGPQLYPGFIYPFMRIIDHVCSYIPLLFATRLLVVLEKI